MYFIALCCVLRWLSVVTTQNVLSDDWRDETYPHIIPHYKVRIDHYSKQPVSRGRFSILRKGSPREILNDTSSKVPLLEFKKALQCAKSEPSINGVRGIIDMLKMLPPTKNITMSVCAWADSNCRWYKCPEVIKEYLPDDNSTAPKKCREPRSERNLIRVMNGQLYTDWPWCVEGNLGPYPSMTAHLHHVLDLISDMKDSVFLVGAEQSEVPWHIPFPIITNSPDFHYSDIPWPWYESLKTEFSLYNEALSRGNDFSPANYSRPFVRKSQEWSKRIPKAAYAGELIHIRHIFYTQALLRPDLIEARWKCDYCGVDPWNPTSTELFSNLFAIDAELAKNESTRIRYSPSQTKHTPIKHSEVGFLEPLRSIRITEPAALPIGHFKYLVVLTGVSARASSGRLASFLAYSGAVVLLQHSEFEYHFSGRLKPWVHYVPLTYSAVDVVAKIEWLRAHDAMAQQIAENARNFGLSYLRLEDQYCYVATVLETLAALVENTDATEPFNPKKLTYGTRRL